MHILIVEDQFSLADAMKAALEKEKFTVAIAADGEHGEDEALSGVYDLIILDVMLPGKNGFEILRSVKSETDTPVIMVTAKSEIEDKLNGLEHGADDYITKPFHIRELIARVNAVLRRVKREKSAVSITVQNECDPIPAEDMEKIFDRFYRVDKARNRSENRFGLGLSIVQALAQHYNGSVRVKCENGITSFTVMLKG